MKPAGWLATILFLGTGMFLPVYSQELPRRCATAYYDSLLKARNPAYRKSRERLEQLIQQQKQAARTQGTNDTQADLLVIPVVVHVVHRNTTNTIGGNNNSNISDAQIVSQIEILNNDFRRKEGTPGFNDDPAGADIGIEFKLADITRNYSAKASYGPGDMDELAKIASISTERYLNIWVTTMSNNYLGYTQFPDATGLPGLDPVNGAENTDGIMIDYRYFGIGGAVASRVYNGGRTTTHEVGHWLGLLHTWGDIDCGNDYIDDTPQIEDANETTDVSCFDVFSNCTGTQVRNMIENYMDYSPDRCMNIFTAGQKERIWQTLNLSPRRKKLVEYNSAPLPESENLTVKLYPNPFEGGSSDELVIELLLKGLQNVNVDVINHLGSLVYSEDFAQTASDRLRIKPGTLARGIYMVRVRTANETKTRRLVID
jgi:hypothetical protein